MMFNCPEQGLAMSLHIEDQLSGSEERPHWKDEEGCGQVTVGRHSTRLQDIRSTEFLIFILNRLVTVDGQLKIVDNKVPVGGNIHLKDASGLSAVFSPIAVIHHTGQVMQNTTSGHYRADVRDFSSGNLIRTSDDSLPQSILSLTDQGYIYLYSKKPECEEMPSVLNKEVRPALHTAVEVEQEDTLMNIPEEQIKKPLEVLIEMAVGYSSC